MGLSRIVILDNGHGGLIGGIYQTNGKRSPDWENGVLYEGVFNRWIVNKVCKRLDMLNIPYYKLVPENEDISLAERVRRVNSIAKKNPNVWLLSQHATAGGGTGFEAFTTKGKTLSDILAEKLIEEIEKTFSNLKMRYDLSDGDKDKEADFYIIKNVVCPAVLVESLFMDNKDDYRLLWDGDFQNALADCYVRVIKRIYDGDY